jgi:excisionase family DNA binding protein
VVNRALSGTEPLKRVLVYCLQQSIATIAAGYAAIDKKSWTEESEPLRLDERVLEIDKCIELNARPRSQSLEVAMFSTFGSHQYKSQRPALADDATNSASPPPSLPERLADSEEAAALMKIHPKTLQKLARQGVIRGIHVGKLWRFRASAIDEWIQSQ